MISRLAMLAQVCLLLVFVYVQYHGLSFFGSDEERAEERAQPGTGNTRGSFHK